MNVWRQSKLLNARSSSWIPATLCVRLPQLDGLVVLERCGGDDVFRGMAGSAQHGVGVSLQLLHHLLALQIPDVDHVVLAAAHDPLKGENTRIKFGENKLQQIDNILLTVKRQIFELINMLFHLTFPPVTEKLANMQYFSFLWPVYVFRHLPFE